jgi:hypothetical protein
MPLPQKSYFFLPEIADRWGTTVRDIATYAHEGLIELSAMAINLRVETAMVVDYEDRGRQFADTGPRCLNGPQPLFPCDVWSVLQDGIGTITSFRMTDPEGRADLAEGISPLRLTLHQLLVTRGERDRFERTYDLRISAAPEQQTSAVFIHSPDFSEVILRGERFRLGPAQASVVRELHAAFERGQPWLNHQVLLQSCAKSARLVDLFKSQANWRSLIVLDRRGSCRLNVPDHEPPKNRQRAFRRALAVANAASAAKL